MLSLVIPTLRIGDKLDQCLASLEGQYDELIVIDDKIGNLSVKINRGLKQAKGDFIIVSNDDVVLEKGSIRDLCVPNQVVSPTILGGVNKVFHAHMFCLPRNVYELSVGTLDGWSDYKEPGFYEGFFRFYWDDADYWMKLKANGYDPVKTSSVELRHDHPGWTLGTFQNNQQAEDINKQIFVRRWGYDAVRETGNG